MTGEEEELVRRWMLRCGIGEGQVSREVRVGEGWDEDGLTGDVLRDGWRTLTDHRVDLVVRWRREVWCVEVKRVLSAGGIGQALVYAVAWCQRNEDRRRVVPAVLAGVGSEVLVGVCGVLGVRCEVERVLRSLRPNGSVSREAWAACVRGRVRLG